MWAYRHLPNQTILSESKWLTAFFTLSLVANAVATCASSFDDTFLCAETRIALLAFRIWMVNRQAQRVLSTNSRADSSRLTPIIRIILESGIFNGAVLRAIL